MSIELPGLGAFLGVPAGFVAMMFVGRVARFILAMREPPDASGNRAYKGRLGIAALAILQPAALFLIALVGVAVYQVFVRRSSEAAWFFGILFGTVVLM